MGGADSSLDKPRASFQESASLVSKGPKLTLKEGDLAPAFSAPASGGATVALRDCKGHHVILYFYPKDDTPGCTKEACAFRDAYAAFRKKKVVILGVSTDSVAKHDKFIAKYELPFTLLADVDHAIVQAYGVWGEKTFMGRRYQGTFRVTFWIGPDGRIRRIWPDVKVADHADDVLAALADG